MSAVSEVEWEQLALFELDDLGGDGGASVDGHAHFFCGRTRHDERGDAAAHAG